MLAVLVALAGRTLGTPTAEQLCQAGRARAAGRYLSCQRTAQAKLQAKGNGETQQYQDFQGIVSRCRVQYTSTWAKLQELAGSSCIGPRFIDNGTTVTDRLTGLEWEKKTNLEDIPNFSDPHDADNAYPSSGTGSDANGGAFTDFLSSLNSGGCFSGQCDWRLPTVDELQTILSQPYPCSSGPCLDLVFGPTQDGRAGGYYWSSSTYAPDSSRAWLVNFYDGFVDQADKRVPPHVRAVRGGW